MLQREHPIGMASFVQYLGHLRSQSLRGRLFHWQVDDSSAKGGLLSDYTQNLEYLWELAREVKQLAMKYYSPSGLTTGKM